MSKVKCSKMGDKSLIFETESHKRSFRDSGMKSYSFEMNVLSNLMRKEFDALFEVACTFFHDEGFADVSCS